LLITLAAWVGGFDGNFDFKDIGLLFPPGVPYVMMRLLPASLGVALIPITYLTLRSLDCTATSSLLGSVLVLFENGLVTQSRHILLDSPLVFFTALSAMFWVAFCAEDRKHPGAGKGQDLSWRSKKSDGPFSYIWWAYLFLTGMALGAVTSCKWVGLFTIATVGFSTCKQLWTMIGDLSISPRTFFRLVYFPHIIASTGY
jgi:dolichyl-phosphate-mannose-protein mannosyltransferase